MDKKLVFLYILLAAFILILGYDYADRILLGGSDDITHIAYLKEFQKGGISTIDLFLHYMAEPARQQRPFSGLYIAANTFFGQHSVFAFYFLKCLYTFIFLASFRMLLKRETKNEYFIYFVLLFASLFPLGAGVYYVVIMWQMYWVLPIYFMHLYLLYNKNTLSYFFSGLLFLVCMLFNEYVVFLSPFVLYLIFIRIPSNKKILKFVLAFALPLILAFAYRYYLVDLIYGNTYKFDEKLMAITLENFIRFIATTLKFFSVYWMSMMKNSFVAMQFYQVWDYVALGISIVISVLIIRAPFFQKDYIIKKREIILVILMFFLTFSFCAITFYKPYITAFNTRIFCMGLFVYPIMMAVLVFAIKNVKLRKIFFLLTIVLSSITLISQKNAWIFTSEFNSKVASENILSTVDFSKSKTILIAADLSKYKQFVIEEPALSHMAPVFRIVRNIEEYPSVDQIILLPNSRNFMGYHYDRNQPNFYYQSPTTIRIRNRIFNYPFYIFDYDAKTVEIIQNKNELEKYQQNYKLRNPQLVE